jgi:FixJ family two-component response regulator
MTSRVPIRNIKNDNAALTHTSVKKENSCVFVIEDDPSMRHALRNLLRSAGLEPELFASACEFWDARRLDVPSCLILDIRLPGLSGLDVQRELSLANVRIPIIFITAHADDFTLNRALKAGAVGFFTKPFCDQDLLDAVYHSLALDRAQRANPTMSR